jgi:hypothetical protein
VIFTTSKNAIVGLILSVLIPLAAEAATPTALLQNSSLFAVKRNIFAFRVPTTDINGKVQYFDIKVKTFVNPDGTFDPIADVIASPSLVVKTGVIQPGTYQSLNGMTTCTVTNVTLTSGRIQSFLNCDFNSGNFFTLSVATGLVSDGHPFQTELVAAGIDQKPDMDTYTWGLATDSDSTKFVGNCNFPLGYIVGAKTNGNQLVLSRFAPNTGVFSCSGTLLRQ